MELYLGADVHASSCTLKRIESLGQATPTGFGGDQRQGTCRILEADTGESAFVH